MGIDAMTINVMTVDDNTVQAEGLKKLFMEFPKINFKGNSPSPEACLRRLENDQKIDVLLLDVNFPGSSMNGKELAVRIRETHPFIDVDGNICGPRIVFFSVENAGYVDRDNGIFGLIPKGEDFSTIIHMIEMVYKRGATYPLKMSTKEKPDFWNKLSTTEKKIFCLVLQAKTNHQIAASFKPSLKEVEELRDTIKEKGRKTTDRSYPKILEVVLNHQVALRIWKDISKPEKKIIRHLLKEKMTKQLTVVDLEQLLKKGTKAGLKFKEINDPNTAKLTTKYQGNLDFWQALSANEKNILRSLMQLRRFTSVSTNSLKNIIRVFTKSKDQFSLIHDPRIIDLLSILEKDLAFWEVLKRKEQLLLLLDAEKLTDQEISAVLIPTISTITVHRKNILSKIKVSGLDVDKIDDPRIVKLALERGLCEIASLS